MLAAFLLLALGLLQAPAPAKPASATAKPASATAKPASATAKPASATVKPIDTPHLTIATTTAKAAAGKTALVIDVTPKEKMHVYSPGQEGVIVISLTLEANPAVTAEKPKYPAGEKLYMPALKETQLVYGKPFKITQDIALKPGSKNVTVKGTLRYQACDDKICYLPKNVPVQWTVGG